MTTSVLSRIAAGDTGAVRECVERYGGLVWSLARRFASTDAEDAVQEIFVDLWKSAPRFDAAAASETTFVAMVARRRLIDRRRRDQRRRDVEPLPEAPPAAVIEDRPELGAEAAIAARALDQLRPEQRQVLILAAYHGLSHEEIATSTGMPLGTVKAHARRGLLRVRELLDGEGAAR